MASFITHYEFGVKVLENLDTNIKKVIKDNYNYYLMGLHGPDILYWYKVIKSNPLKQKGDEIHLTRGCDYFNSIKIENDKSLAYHFGFMCHFALDSKIHEYIYKICSSFDMHVRLESDLDKYMLKEYNFIDDRDLYAKKLDILPLSNHFLGISEKELKKSVNNFVNFSHVLKHKKLLSILRNKKIMLYTLKDKIEYNLECEKMHQIFKEQINNAVTLISDYFNFKKVKKQDYNFEGDKYEKEI